MSDRELLEQFLAYLEDTKRSSRNTLAAYRRDLNQYIDYLCGASVTVVDAVEDDIESFKTHLEASGFSAASVCRFMSSVRGLYKYLLQKGILRENPSRSVKNVKSDKHTPEILTSKEVELLLAQPNTDDLKGIRDKAMLEVLYATGMKVTELISLDMKDVNLAFGFVVCHGEGQQKHDRTVYLYPAALRSLGTYLSDCRPYLAEKDSDVLFVNINGCRMTRQGFWKILKGYADKAGIDKTITPLTLRHSFATHLLANGADIHDIKEILGHSDLASTQVYAAYLKSKARNSYLKYHPLA